MAYANTWNSTDQVALRALTTGQIGLYGALDPTDGGDTSRFSLSGRIAQSTDDGSWKANAYLVKYTMDLFNNYTWDTESIRPTATSSISTTIASTAEAAPRAPSTARCSICRPKPCSACNPATMTSSRR